MASRQPPAREAQPALTGLTDQPFRTSPAVHHMTGSQYRTADISCRATIVLSPSVTKRQCSSPASRTVGGPAPADRSRRDERRRGMVNVPSDYGRADPVAPYSPAHTPKTPAPLASTQVSADACGYRKFLDFAQARAPGRRCWAVEGAGSYGAGLSAFLTGRDEHVAEVCRPMRPPGAGARTSDAIDAVRAADLSFIGSLDARERLRSAIRELEAACAITLPRGANGWE